MIPPKRFDIFNWGMLRRSRCVLIFNNCPKSTKQQLVTMYYCDYVGYDWWLCMVINISIQYSGGLLLDIILLTQGYYQWGTRLNKIVLQL